LNFIFGIVCLFVCVCAFSLRRESPDMILGDKPLISEVVLSHSHTIWLLQRAKESFLQELESKRSELLLILEKEEFPV
jgi:hypothetical protein